MSDFDVWEQTLGSSLGHILVTLCHAIHEFLPLLRRDAIIRYSAACEDHLQLSISFAKSK